MMPTANEPPIEYPKVSIGGQLLTVRFTFLAQYQLSKWNIDMGEFGRQLSTIKPAVEATETTPAIPGKSDPRLTAMITDVFAACVADNFVDLGQAVPTPEYWAARMGNAFGSVARAVIIAMGKAKPPASPAPDNQATGNQPIN